MKTIVIRVDASNLIGRGHAMRCLSLADGLRAWGSEPYFICREMSGDLIALLQARHYRVYSFKEGDDAEQTLTILQEINRDCDEITLIVDHYNLEIAWEQKIRIAVSQLIVLDDLANRQHDCNLLIDPSLDRKESDYKNLVPENARLLLGPSYALLSNTYSSLRYSALAHRNQTDSIKRLIVSMGGTDPDNATTLIMDALFLVKTVLSIDVVVSSTWPQLQALKEKASHLHHKMHFHVDMPNLAELMLAADLAIGAGGVTAYERCCLGLPTIMIAIADNQHHNARTLQHKKATLFLGDASALHKKEIANAVNALIHNPLEWKSMSRAAATVCDGYGVNRVVSQLLLEKSSVNLRPVTFNDSELILAWQQNPTTREYARNTNAPSRSEHEQWLQKRLNNPNCLFNLVVLNNEPVGVLRFDRVSDQSNTFEISILVAPQHRKKGIAASALRLSRKLFPNLDFYAEVYANNKASHQLFSKAGYVFENTGYFNRGE